MRPVPRIDAFRRGCIEGGRRPAVRPLDVSPPVLHFGSREAKKETEGAVVLSGGVLLAPLPVATAAVHTNRQQTSPEQRKNLDDGSDLQVLQTLAG